MLKAVVRDRCDASYGGNSSTRATIRFCSASRGKPTGRIAMASRVMFFIELVFSQLLWRNNHAPLNCC